MQAHHVKINNSYESEISSNSGSSCLDDSTYENRSFDGTLPKLQDIFKPQFYGVESLNEADSVDVDIEKNRNTKISDNATIHSSQESEFLGFPVDKEYLPCFVQLGSRQSRLASKAVSSSDESDFLGFSSDPEKKGESQIYYSSQESDFTGFPESSSEKATASVLLPTKETAYVVSEQKTSSLPGNQSSAKPMGEDTDIFEMTNADNSCNAVDVKLFGDQVDIPHVSKLSFDGAIKPSVQTPLHVEKSINYESNKDALELESDTSQTYKYVNERSPDLFDDEEDYDNATTEPATKYTQEQFSETTEDTSFTSAASEKEGELLKRIQKSLSGIPPPPSVTIMQIDMFNSVTKNKENILKFFDNLDTQQRENESIFKPTHSVEEAKLMNWPEILSARSHGLCYNLSTVTEKIEILSLSVLERYVGAETCSSFQKSPSSAKKRAMRMKMLSQSPGSRLSHLARRRAIYSSANLQSYSQKVTTRKITCKQIMLDSKKSENRRKQKIITPKRRTPGKRKSVRKTPSSSAKKKLLFRTEQASTAPSRETSKRALFQSPPQQQKLNTKPVIKPEIATRVEKSKRALFSPEKPGSSFATMAYPPVRPGRSDENLTKRRREDDDTEENCSKLTRTDSFLNVENLTPRALKIKSQSFCGGSGIRPPLDTITGKSLFRTSSDTTFCSSQLSESHRKKLLWAVSQALQSKQISLKHPSFKQYASTLARVVKRLFLENCRRSGSTSDTLLRLAKKHVFWVIQGKTADDIYLQERAKLQNEKLLAPKPTGYIAPEDYENRKMLVMKSSQSTIFSENSMDSFNLSQALEYNITQSSQNSGFISQVSQDSLLPRDSRLNSAIKLPIQKSPSLQNSSSKNNLTGSALRENVDCEQRRSAQKNFTGKDQKNLSPYSDKVRSSAKKYPSIYETNTMKVKRQISFDS